MQVFGGNSGRLGLAAAALAVFLGSASGPHAQVIRVTESAGGWIDQRLADECTPVTRQAVRQAVRDRIEQEVRRAESAFLSPTPVGDLGCIDDLMQNTLKIFSGGFGLPDLFSARLKIDLCGFAQSKWSEITQPLQAVNAKISSFTSGLGGNYNLPSSGPVTVETDRVEVDYDLTRQTDGVTDDIWKNLGLGGN